MKILDLGCWKNKRKGAFGVDFNKYKGVDLVWDLNNPLPECHHGKYDRVYAECIIDHLGNPLNFLNNCRLLMKDGAHLILMADNADYWRFHFEHKSIIGFFGAYHATLWLKEDPHLITQHKMMFQLKHLEYLLKLAGFSIIKLEYVYRKNIDALLPARFGSMYIKAVAKNI